jgi:hypothetical protein
VGVFFTSARDLFFRRLMLVIILHHDTGETSNFNTNQEKKKAQPASQGDRLGFFSDKY